MFSFNLMTERNILIISYL